jgi:hypothetical protein
MPLAYAFWHRPHPDVAAETYERDLQTFHERLAAVPIPGFRASRTLRVPDLPWLPGGGYEDWYVIDDFAALGTLATAAVDAPRAASHEALARSVRDGAGGVYALRAGTTFPPASWCGWFSKQDGVSYPELISGLQEQVHRGDVLAVWQRQLVLGPAPEFRIETRSPVSVPGAQLAVGVPMVLSG